MKRLFFVVIFLFSVFVISSCSSGSSTPQNAPTNIPSQEVEAPSQAASVDDKQMASDDVQVIKMVAKQWEFDPNPIVVKKDVPVQLEIESVDVAHGFTLSEFDISCEPSNCDIKPGETTVVRFTPDRTGTFTFRCSVFCGSGHSRMTGQLVVE